VPQATATLGGPEEEGARGASKGSRIEEVGSFVFGPDLRTECHFELPC